MIYAIILKMLKASYADMAKLADALASGANRGNPVQVQVLLSAFFIGRHLIRCLPFFIKKQSRYLLLNEIAL